jgi:hypothetical protein
MAWSSVVYMLTATLDPFVFLVAILSNFNQAPVGRIRIYLVNARYAAASEIAILKIVCLLFGHMLGLSSRSSSCCASLASAVHQVHVVALVVLEFVLMLLLGLHVLIHLICDIQGNFFVGARMCIEKLVRLFGTEKEDPVLEVLLFQLSHLLVHDQRLGEVLKLSLALAFDLGVDLDEYLEITSHHIG